MSERKQVWWKVSGAGNTFFIFDHREKIFDRNYKLQWIKKLCSGQYDLFADGVIFIEEPESQGDFSWDFFNADGSTAEMCGNAARCAALFFFNYIRSQKNVLVIETKAGAVKAQIIAEPMKDSEKAVGLAPHRENIVSTVKVTMTPFQDLGNKTLFIHQKPVSYRETNSGVPHLVRTAMVDFSKKNDLLDEARCARKHQDLGLQGSNVTYYQEIRLGAIRAMTFERGVESFTEACGTGAVAAAFIYNSNKNFESVLVEMPGGILEVDVSSRQYPQLIGPVRFQFQLQFCEGA